MSGLSGGTWFLGPWVQSGLPPAEFAATLPPKITRDFVSAPADVGHLVKSLLTRFAFKQPISPVNIYGRLLAVNIMTGIKNGPFNTYLHEQIQQVQNGKWIFPIYTALATKLPYQWVEWTPYEFRGISLADIFQPGHLVLHSLMEKWSTLHRRLIFIIFWQLQALHLRLVSVKLWHV